MMTTDLGGIASKNAFAKVTSIIDTSSTRNKHPLSLLVSQRLNSPEAGSNSNKRWRVNAFCCATSANFAEALPVGEANTHGKFRCRKMLTIDEIVVVFPNKHLLLLLFSY